VIRRLNKLSATEAANAGPGWHSDGGGLFLRADDQGRRRWIFRYTFRGKKKEMGLGAVAAVTLAKARAEAKKLREAVAQGGDPLAERRHAVAVAAKAKTFAEVARTVTERDQVGWGASSREAWRRSLFDHAERLGRMDVNAIDIEHIVEALQPLWDRSAHASAPLDLEPHRGRARHRDCAQVAQDRQRRQLEDLQARRAEATGPRRGPAHAMVAWEKAPAVVKRLQAYDTIAARALMLAVLTGVRISEATGAQWIEFDFDRKLWFIPGPRMKMRQPHVVPLSRQAIELLDELLMVRTGDNVFPSPIGDKPVSRVQAWRVAKAVTDGAATTHGFRSTFRSWCAAHRVDREVAELAIAHTAGGVEGRYQRDPMIERRRPVMQAWSDFLDGKVEVASDEARIVPFEGKRRLRSPAHEGST
jgi:integrase